MEATEGSKTIFSTEAETKPPTINRLGLVGLGLMGTAIAHRLIEHGYHVVLWNRTRDKANVFIERGATWSDNPFAECERVILSLYSSDVVVDVLTQMKHSMRSGQTIIDTTTGVPEESTRIASELHNIGVRYLDAPISGSSEQTRRGEAIVMVGGANTVFQECNNLWPVLGKKVFYVGPSGSAAKMKLVSNLVLGLNRAALAEGLAFAESMNVSPQSALDVLKESVAYSKVMDIKGDKMIARDYATQAKLSQHLKDVRLINESATRNQLPLSLSFAHQAVLEQAERDGFGEHDNCSIIEYYRMRPHD